MAAARTKTAGSGRRAAPAKTAASRGSRQAKATTAKSSNSTRGNGKAAAPSTVTLRQIAAMIADNHDMPRKAAEAMMGDLVTLLVKNLKRGKKVRMSSLGILEVKKRAARAGRNPRTGETVKIKAGKRVAFRASKELKEAL